jgi:hypothetical protein
MNAADMAQASLGQLKEEKDAPGRAECADAVGASFRYYVE